MSQQPKTPLGETRSLFAFFAALAIPLGIVEDFSPVAEAILPLTGTGTGQTGLLLTIAYFLSEIRQCLKKD